MLPQGFSLVHMKKLSTSDIRDSPKEMEQPGKSTVSLLIDKPYSQIQSLQSVFKFPMLSQRASQNHQAPQEELQHEKQRPKQTGNYNLEKTDSKLKANKQNKSKTKKDDNYNSLSGKSRQHIHKTRAGNYKRNIQTIKKIKNSKF